MESHSMPKRPQAGAADGTFIVRVGHVMVGVGLGVRVGGTGVALGTAGRVGVGGDGVSVGGSAVGVSVGAGGRGVSVGDCVLGGSGVGVSEGLAVVTESGSVDAGTNSDGPGLEFISRRSAVTSTVAARAPRASPPKTATAHGGRRLAGGEKGY